MIFYNRYGSLHQSYTYFCLGKPSVPESSLKIRWLSNISNSRGNALRSFRVFYVSFNIDGSLYPFQTYVMKNLSHEVILGREFLSIFAKTIDFENFHSHLNPPSLPETPLYEQASTFLNTSLATLKAPDQLIVLPPRTETVFRCSVPLLQALQDL